MKTSSKRIEAFLKNRQKDVVDFCSKLIQAGGENPPGDVSEAADVVETFLDENGISFKRHEPAKGHANVLATVGKGKPKIILCGHIDVVPAGDRKHWKFPPYSGKIENDKILGRGASDMKGGIAAMLMAGAALEKVENELGGTTVFATVCDEEANGPAGAHWLLENHKLEGDICLITEPTGYAHSQYSVICGERGVLWVKITARGKPAHGSTPAFGENAILGVTKFLKRLHSLEDMPVKTPKDAKTLVHHGKLDLATTAKGMQLNPKELTRTLDHYTVNVGTIRGGTKTNIVPELCEAEVDIRVPAGGNPDAVEEFIKFVLPENLDCEVTNRISASYTPADEPLIRLLQKQGKTVFGYKPPAIYQPATSDAHSFRETLRIPTVSFGPGFGEVNHAYNEFVNVQDVVNASKVYAHTIANYLCQ